MTRIYLIRHGNTFSPGAPPLRIGARTDLPLVASGMDQAEALADHFSGAGIRFATIFASPLTRAMQTAQIIGGQARLENLELLNEIDHGPDEGRPESEVLARLGSDALRQWDETGQPPKDWVVNKKERVAGWRAFFARAIGDWPDDNVALVTSNGAARFALLALDPSPELATLKLPTGAYGIIEVAPHGAARLMDWNVRPETARKSKAKN